MPLNGPQRKSSRRRCHIREPSVSSIVAKHLILGVARGASFQPSSIYIWDRGLS